MRAVFLGYRVGMLPIVMGEDNITAEYIISGCLK